MNRIRFVLGAAGWYLRAGLWYAGLGFRLYFAAGLDQDFNPGKDDVAKTFRCPIPRTYRRYLESA